MLMSTLPWVSASRPDFILHGCAGTQRLPGSEPDFLPDWGRFLSLDVGLL